MNRSNRKLVLLLVAMVLAAGPATADAAEGWSIPKLWPFGDKKSSKTTSVWPKKNSSRKKKSSSAIGQISSDAKSALDKSWQKTWDTTKSIATLGGSDKKRKQRKPASSRSKPKSKISLAGFFGEKTNKPVQARTTKEFLGQKRTSSAFRN